ncbi:MAG TPA: DUF2269 family protein [Gaiellaceae bacterium]|jgi:uncharacterized membrane protein|nr:DUF2269 family protein [Gaiellaceae bacterium]
METPAVGSAAPSARRSANLTYALLGLVVVVGAIFAFSGSAVMPNNWYALFKAVHVVFAVIWIGGGSLLIVNGIRAQRADEPKTVVLVAQQAAFAGEKIFAPAGLVVFLMGIAMMINTSWGWGHFWIVAGLIGYAATFVTGVAVLSPLAKKIAASAEANGPEHPETLALIDRILFVGRIDVALLMLVIVDMVTKPFA